MPLDFADDNFLDLLRQTTDSLDLGLRVSSVSDVDGLLRLNVRAPGLIANHYGKQLAKRRRGSLILVSSTIVHQSTPMMGEYGATKAHQLYLGEALFGELKQHGVDVTVLSPGPTRTERVTTMDKVDVSKAPML